MLRSRFLWKLYAGYALVILLSSLFVGGMVARRVESETLIETDRRLRSIAFVVREVVQDHTGPDGLGAARLQDRIREMGGEIDVRLTVVRADGVVVADSVSDPPSMGNHADRPEILQAYAEGAGSATRFSKTLGQKLRYYSILSDSGGEVMVVRSSLPLTVLEERLGDLRRTVFLGALLATLAALFLGFLYARRVTRPILSMAQAATEIAGGAYDQRVDRPGRDELATLARAFNTMSRELQGSISALDADRDKLKAILGSMEEGVVAVDRDERVVHLNGVAAQLLKVSEENALRRPFWEMVRLREVSEILGEVLETSHPVQRTVRLMGPPERELRLRATPLLGEAGPVGAVLILEDVTRLRRLETMRRDFVGNVSHELKTPVTAIRGMIDTLLDDPEIDPTLRDRFHRRVLLQTERMGNLVTDLLSLARLESADPLSDQVPLDLSDSVRQTLVALQPMSEARSVEIRAELPEEPLYAIGDEEFLRQAIGNLLNNGIKFSPEGGEVIVRLREDADWAVIEIQDFGIGISVQHQERLFERFYRVDKARSRELGGTGLGLAIVKHIVRSMDGEVSVASTPGSGSTFRIHLPLSSPQPDES